MARIIQTRVSLDSSCGVYPECVLSWLEQHQSCIKGVVKMSKFVESRISITLFILWLSSLATLELIPTSIWFDVKSLHVADAPVGISPSIALVREINKDFTAEWQVTIHDVTSGTPRGKCVIPYKQKYFKNSTLAPDINLAWLTLGNCTHLIPGKYIATVQYDVITPWFMPNKHDEVTSNVFTIF